MKVIFTKIMSMTVMARSDWFLPLFSWFSISLAVDCLYLRVLWIKKANLGCDGYVIGLTVSIYEFCKLRKLIVGCDGYGIG